MVIHVWIIPAEILISNSLSAKKYASMEKANTQNFMLQLAVIKHKSAAESHVEACETSTSDVDRNYLGKIYNGKWLVCLNLLSDPPEFCADKINWNFIKSSLSVTKF